jgi:hypothetical protein
MRPHRPCDGRLTKLAYAVQETGARSLGRHVRPSEAQEEAPQRELFRLSGVPQDCRDYSRRTRASQEVDQEEEEPFSSASQEGADITTTHADTIFAATSESGSPYEEAVHSRA